MRWTIGILLLLLWLFSFLGPIEGWWLSLMLAVATVVWLVKGVMRDPESSWS